MLLMIGACSCLMAQQPGSDDGTVLDDTIKPLHFEELKYAPLARQARLEGIVVVWATLDSQGNVASAVAISGSKGLIDLSHCLDNAKKMAVRSKLKKRSGDHLRLSA